MLTEFHGNPHLTPSLIIITCWVSCLYHKGLDDSVEDMAIVVTLTRVDAEILNCFRATGTGQAKQAGVKCMECACVCVYALCVHMCVYASHAHLCMYRVRIYASCVRVCI